MAAPRRRPERALQRAADPGRVKDVMVPTGMVTMKRIAFAGVVLIALLAGGPAGAADDYTAGGLTIEQPWARATPAKAKIGVVYLTIRNGGGQDDRLTAATTPASNKAELHTHVMEGNVMKMRPVKGIDVKGGGTIALAPGGYHLMLMGLEKPLREGGRFPLTLSFEKAGSVTVEVEVKAMGAMGAMGDGHGMKH